MNNLITHHNPRTGRYQFFWVGCVTAMQMCLWVCGIASAAPAIFWASDPIRPGETAMLIGDGFGANATVEISRLTDEQPAEPTAAKISSWPGLGIKVEVLQGSEQSLKFRVPADWKSGVFTFRVTVGGESASGFLNRPQMWWAQGDLGTNASPGGWIRAFGKNLGWGGPLSNLVTTVRLEGPRVAALPAVADAFSVRAEIPADLPAGSYQLFLHNGAGGDAAWSEPVSFTISPASSWPQTLFNVRNFGARGDGIKDDTAALVAALGKAQTNGGGIVFLPRGKYAVSNTISISRGTVLRGEKEEWVCLAWPDFTNPPAALIQGSNSFGLENLTLYANNHQHVIVGDLGGKPQAGNVFLRYVRVRADAYRGHPGKQEVDTRFRRSLELSSGGGDTVRVGGVNIEFSNCDFYGSGRAFFLSRVRGGRVAGNQFFNGRWGWYCISGSDGLIFENNLIQGADLMSTGGGLNCLDGSKSSQNVYFARNRLSLFHGWDREALTTDAGGEAYSGQINMVNGAKLGLGGEPKDSIAYSRGAGVFILSGRGAGQYRHLMGYRDKIVEVDRPWGVEPDTNSFISITSFQGHYLLLDNQFIDTGALQLYGTSIECIVAGNHGTRMQGFRDLGMWYYGYQPSWFCQLLDNQISEGNYYHWSSVTDSAIEVEGGGHPPYAGPLTCGTVVRRNWLENNAQIKFSGVCRDIVVEDNRVENAERGIYVGPQTTNVLVRGNEFVNVLREVEDKSALSAH